MNKLIKYLFIILILFNQVSIVFSKLQIEQCDKWKKLNKQFNKLLINKNGINFKEQDGCEMENKLNINKVMLKVIFKKYCSKHPDELLLEEIEGNDCLILKKIIKDLIIEQENTQDPKCGLFDNHSQKNEINNKNINKITSHIKHYNKELIKFNNDLLEFSQQLCAL